jgi:hypothetical protein
MVKAGFLRNMSSACLTSFQRSPTVRSYGGGWAVYKSLRETELCKSEADVEGRSIADVIRKQVIHGIADAIAQIVTDGAHSVEPGD